MLSRFLEVQDEAHTNHGKFFLMQFGRMEREHRSAITKTPLIGALKPVARLGGRLSPSAVFLIDLQTQEGMFFDPYEDADLVKRRFLVHPLHVCILYFPLMMLLAQKRAAMWQLPNLITLSAAEVNAQPGALVDLTGAVVRGQFEWSQRLPFAARLRNREVLEGGDPYEGQSALTAEELAASVNGKKPVWRKDG